MSPLSPSLPLSPPDAKLGEVTVERQQSESRSSSVNPPDLHLPRISSSICCASISDAARTAMDEKPTATAMDEEAKWGTSQMGSYEAPPAHPQNQQAIPKAASPAEEAKWGTSQMGSPAAPQVHPQNQQAAAYWGPHRGDEERPPYVLLDPTQYHRGGGAAGASPMESILDAFNSWARKAEALASNVWQNLRTAPSMADAAWGKVSLTAKALTEGGFETLYRQTFPSDPSERVKKTFACYFSTTTGPVAGTLYLTTANVAFCSDRPLSFKAPSGQDSWSYYKIRIPLEKIETVNPVTVRENPPEKYIQIVTVDGHDFWFMGFVSYDKAIMHLLNTISDAAAARRAGEGAAAPGFAGASA
ncbi:GEM-like protein 5 [Apostasia shenzhenica]|uniref:GEM-like protein 5 n=1 Tax=Apostasia shenzhenica TaxID=1088818 RepID=A0A2I0B980_9ASPA|nr:GEM-like protein 5 [Apostasia shenzhenica]